MSPLAKLKWSTRCLNHLVLYAYCPRDALGGAELHLCSIPDTEAMRATDSTAEVRRVAGLMVMVIDLLTQMATEKMISVDVAGGKLHCAPAAAEGGRRKGFH